MSLCESNKKAVVLLLRMQGKIKHLPRQQATTENKDLSACMLCKALHKLLLSETMDIVLFKTHAKHSSSLSLHSKQGVHLVKTKSVKVKSRHVMMGNWWCNTPQSTSAEELMWWANCLDVFTDLRPAGVVFCPSRGSEQ